MDHSVNLRFAPTLHVFKVTVEILNTHIKLGLPGVSPSPSAATYVDRSGFVGCGISHTPTF